MHRVKLDELANPERMNAAVRIYLQHAFDDAALAERHLTVFEAGLSVEGVLSRFHCVTPSDAEAHRCYELRLGSQEYPNMKLAIQEAWLRGEFILSVDRHDAFAIESTMPDYAQWAAVRERNRSRKTKIEKAWYEAGLPTARRLKEERFKPEDVKSVFAGHEILVVDDDEDAMEVVGLILSSAGFQNRLAPDIPTAAAIVQEKGCRIGMALVDVMLADGPGYEVVRIIRETPAVQDIPILLMTGLSSTEVLRSDSGVRYLRKPYNGAQLLDTVRRTLLQEYGGCDRFLES